MRSFGDVAGIFAGKSGKSGYIARMTKGELTLHGYREVVYDPMSPLSTMEGKIKKRGRKTLIKLLQNYRWIKNHKQISKLTWGIKNA